MLSRGVNIWNNPSQFAVFFGETAFVTTWDTENLGGTGSATKVILLPMTAGVEVDWGDGTVDNLNTHTYAAGGIKTVKIEGAVTGFRFNNGGDKLKITDVSNVGGLVIDANGMFNGCTNLVWTATDTPTLTTVSLQNFFKSCSSFTGNVNAWDTSGVTSTLATFQGCSSFNSPLNNWDVSSVSVFATMLISCTIFNQDLSSWTTSSATNMNGLFQSCSAFDQDLSGFDVSGVTTANNMLLSSGFTQTNYDLLLPAWDAQTLQSGVPFHAGTAKFGAGAPATAKTNMVDNDLWTITDGGAA